MNKKADRNQFILDEFLDGARLNDIVKNPSVTIQYGAVRQIVVKALGHSEYRRILMMNKKQQAFAKQLTRSLANPKQKPLKRKTFWQWLLGGD
mgnify:FL=1|tara:strand:+ start:556 stop:834 length:279 start_codon:yes stop_codon:yes gene_type:complete